MGVYFWKSHLRRSRKKENCVTDDQTCSVAAKTRKQLQALSRFVNHTIVDKIFGGQLVSTIVCEQCQNSSQIYEPFLDLSLPLVEEKPARPSQSNDQVKGHKRTKSENSLSSCFGSAKVDDDAAIEEGPNKNKSKKERERLKKEKRRARKVKGNKVSGQDTSQFS